MKSSFALYLIEAILVSLVGMTFVLGLGLFPTRFRATGKKLLFCSAGAYIGWATASFTSIGIPFILYTLNAFNFKSAVERAHNAPTTLDAWAVFIILFLLPFAGLIGGSFLGLVQCRMMQNTGKPTIQSR